MKRVKYYNVPRPSPMEVDVDSPVLQQENIKPGFNTPPAKEPPQFSIGSGGPDEKKVGKASFNGNSRRKYAYSFTPNKTQQTALIIMSNFSQEIVGREWDDGHVADSTRNAISALIAACDDMTKRSLIKTYDWAGKVAFQWCEEYLASNPNVGGVSECTVMKTLCTQANRFRDEIKEAKNGKISELVNNFHSDLENVEPGEALHRETKIACMFLRQVLIEVTEYFCI
jgi:hypothetical protein